MTVRPLAVPFEEWLSDSRSREVIDVLIVGSGYGASVAAARLAGSKRSSDGGLNSVVVLERGREYLPGEFPEKHRDRAETCPDRTRRGKAPPPGSHRL